MSNTRTGTPTTAARAGATAQSSPKAARPASPRTRPLWTVRRRKLVDRFVAEAAARLRLADWEIIIDYTTHAGDDAVATIWHVPCQKRAVLLLNAPVFLSETAHNQRQTLVHELLHCHLFDVHETAALAAEAIPGAAHTATFKTLLTQRVEYATDALADAFVALCTDLPVPATGAPLRMAEALMPGDTSTAEATPETCDI